MKAQQHPLNTGHKFQDPQWIPETAGSTYVCTAISPASLTHVSLIYKLDTVRD